MPKASRAAGPDDRKADSFQRNKALCFCVSGLLECFFKDRVKVEGYKTGCRKGDFWGTIRRLDETFRVC